MGEKKSAKKLNSAAMMVLDDNLNVDVRKGDTMYNQEEDSPKQAGSCSGSLALVD